MESKLLTPLHQAVYYYEISSLVLKSLYGQIREIKQNVIMCSSKIREYMRILLEAKQE